MVMDTQPAGTHSGAALVRIVCGCWTLLLSLVCVVSSFRSAIETPGTDALTMWIFFLWGAGVSAGGVWLIRGRSKGKAIILVRDRRRIVLLAAMTAVVVGLLIYLTSGTSLDEDPLWPLMLRTMFAVLFASLPFMVFDREDHEERNAPMRLSAAGRRKARWLILLMVVIGASLLGIGIAADAQLGSWWSSFIRQVGTALLASGAVTAFQLRKKRSADPDAEAGSPSDT